MFSQTPRQQLRDEWAEKAHCPICQATPLKVVRQPGLPDQMTCSRCQVAFELSEQDTHIRLVNLPPTFPPGLAGHWLTLEEVSVAARRAAARQVPSQPQSASASSPSKPRGEYVAPFVVDSGDSSAAPASPQTVAAPASIQEPEKPLREAATAAKPSVPRSSAAAARATANPFALPLAEGQSDGPVHPDVLNRAGELFEAGNTPEQIQIALEKSRRFTQPQIQEVMSHVRALQAKRDFQQRLQLWIAIAIVAMLAFLCLAVVVYLRFLR